MSSLLINWTLQVELLLWDWPVRAALGEPSFSDIRNIGYSAYLKGRDQGRAGRKISRFSRPGTCYPASKT